MDVNVALDECLPAWGITWEALGAESRSGWRVRCQDEWEAVRADLEARELPAAEDQCTDASAELADLRAADDGACDELRALYVE